MKVAGRVEVVSTAVWVPDQFEVPPPSYLASPAGNGMPDLSVEAVPVSPVLAAPEMAVLAAQTCLEKAGWDSSRLHSLLYSHIYHQGHDWWPVAHYIADRLGVSSRTMPIVVQQGCNGGMASLALAASMLLADPDAEAVLIAAGDRFGAPGWPRWEYPGPPCSYGDGASAALLRRCGDQPVGLAVLSLAHSTDPSLEQLFRGEDEFTPAPMWNKASMSDGADTSRLGGQPPVEQLLAMRARTRESLLLALADAGIDPGDGRIRYVLLPRLCSLTLEAQYGSVLDTLVHAEPLAFGRRTGHLASSDVIANLAELEARGLLAVGEIAVLVNVGAGATWSTAVVQAGAGWRR